jgi:protein gp37
VTDTKIEWTDKVWNPTTGCDKVSPGCDHCYALTLARRLKGMGSAKYQNDGNPRTSGPGFGITIHDSALEAPLTWTKPRRVFVNSMSDLFHDGVPDEFIARVFAVMALTERHTYQVLTKRHGRMRSLLSSERVQADVDRNVAWHTEAITPWPLPNVWLGVSVEDQKRAELRIPALQQTPAAVHFLSCEPLLGPVDIINGIGDSWMTNIDWVIAGGESGAVARPMDLDWVRSLRDQCEVAGVAFFYKQQGSGAGGLTHRRELDGRTWEEFPADQVAAS